MQRRKISIRKICTLIIAIIGGGIILNLFLTYRLERFLKKELSERVAVATDGFYQLTFDKLTIGLLNGELGIEGVVFKPDSIAFQRKLEKDSLPNVYLEVQLDKIFFRGINLAWRFNYKKLNFNLFEIQKPIVTITETNQKKDNDEKNVVNEPIAKIIYSLINPYINTLSVNRINLENANITYQVEDHIQPSIYALENVSFHAYGFLLDENSYASGKLLYCDDFEFTTNQEQTLLSTSQMLLHTDTIFLSTKDSVVQIGNLRLIPQSELWIRENKMPANYLDASVKEVNLEGIYFVRENTLNYLHAHSFDINKSNISYTDFKKDSLKTTENKTDTIIQPWTLYEVVSPFLHRISIENIAIRNANMRHSSIADDFTDTYTLDEFNFNAYNFQVDSLADLQKKFLYSENFEVDAVDIEGVISGKNHSFNVGNLFLNTLSGEFLIRNIQLWPISTKNATADYMKGTIDSISMKGLVYETGIVADEFSIDNPVVEYVRMPAVKKKIKINASKSDSLSMKKWQDVNEAIDLITPYFGFLAVKKVNLKNGNITFIDRLNRRNNQYRLPKIDFSATNVLINEKTIKESDTYLTFDNFELAFEKFDNVFSDYRLIIDKGNFTGLGGDLILKNVRLTPREKTSSDFLMNLSIPSLKAKQVNYSLNKNEFVVYLNNLEIISPIANVKKIKETQQLKKENNLPEILKINLNNLNITDADIAYKDQTNKDSIHFSTENIYLSSLDWQIGNYFQLGELALQTADILIKKQQENKKEINTSVTAMNFPEKATIGKIKIANNSFLFDSPELKLNTKINLDVDRVLYHASDLSLQAVNLYQPIVEITQINYSKDADTLKLTLPETRTPLETLFGHSQQIAVNAFFMKDASINYTHVLDEKVIRQQQVNATNLDFTKLYLDGKKKSFDVDELNFSTTNLQLPVDNGFYTLMIKNIDLNKKEQQLKANQIHLLPTYPKWEFAYRHPKHKDWFDVYVDTLQVSKINFPAYFSTGTINIGDIFIKNAELFNSKNQKIHTERRLSPMLYEKLQKAPFPLNIKNIDVSNLYVQYEELTKGGTVPSKLFFTEMNGKFTGFTNIPSDSTLYIRLNADGKLMGEGYFTAIWDLPVDSLNDHFKLSAVVNEFDLRNLNQLITPMAPASIESGMIDRLSFTTDASSIEANVQMELLYNNLHINVLKNKDGELTPDKFVNTLVGWVIKEKNPDKKHKKPRQPNSTVERNPYRSTFNYIWQILKPPLIESVGVSQKKQNFFGSVGNFFSKVKKYFSKKE